MGDHKVAGYGPLDELPKRAQVGEIYICDDLDQTFVWTEKDGWVEFGVEEDEAIHLTQLVEVNRVP